MAPVAVTGATGLIGSAVVRHLVAAGRDVRALVEPGARTENLDELPGVRVDRVTADVTDAAGMRRALDGCEALYHLAAVYKVWAPDPSIIHRVNVEGTLTTLLAAQAAGVRRIVHTSSIAAVGLRDDGRPSDETCAFNLWPIANAYVLSKHLSERVALNAAAAGLPVVVVNPGFPFGPGDRAPTPTGRIVLSVLKGEVPATSAGGFAAIDVDDCAAGHLAAEERGRVGERYLLVNHNVTFHDFVTEVARRADVHGPRVRVPRQAAWALGLAYELVADHVTHVEPPATYRAVRYATRDAFFDNAKARRELALPTRPLTETIDRAIAFFRATGMDRALPNFAIERAGRGNALARMSRTYLVTGANTGIGRVTAEELARKGGRVFLACRSKDKTMPVIEGIRAAGGFAEFVPLDLADLASVRACAADFAARKEPLHVLVNNAGLAGLRGLTKDGFELTFGTNHLGHFLLTKLLLPLLEEADDARIVNVSSKSHYRAKGIDWDALRKPTATTTGLPEYEVSKLANVLFTKELSRRLGGKVHSYALHPGVVASDAWRQIPWGIRHVMKLFMITNEDGAKTTLYCATSPEVKDHDGRYYDSCKERKPSKLSEDAALAKELWERSEAWVAGLSSSVAPRVTAKRQWSPRRRAPAARSRPPPSGPPAV